MYEHRTPDKYLFLFRNIHKEPVSVDIEFLLDLLKMEDQDLPNTWQLRLKPGKSVVRTLSAEEVGVLTSYRYKLRIVKIDV
jgi:hypothetical protein